MSNLVDKYTLESTD